jgi:hypothetical protein
MVKQIRKQQRRCKMKNQKNVVTLIWAVLFLMLLIGCQNQSPVAPLQNDSSGKILSLSKPPVVDNSYPQTCEHIYTYWRARDIYRGGSLMMPNGTVVNLTAGALMPPSSTPWGEDVTITCTIDKDETNNELIFTFGPSGCQFNPSVKVFLDYKDLNIETPNK